MCVFVTKTTSAVLQFMKKIFGIKIAVKKNEMKPFKWSYAKGSNN